MDLNRELIQRAARELWKAREMRAPERVRRMEPDAMDMTTGAWALCVNDAAVVVATTLASIADLAVSYDTPIHDDIGMQEQLPGEGEWLKVDDIFALVEPR